jgi:RNase P subunit RPR2
MKVILKRGQIPQEKWYQTTCSNCNTHFKFQKKDSRYNSSARDIVHLIECPECDKTLYLSTLIEY